MPYYAGRENLQPRTTRITRITKAPLSAKQELVRLLLLLLFFYPCYPCYPWLLCYRAGVIPCPCPGAQTVDPPPAPPDAPRPVSGYLPRCLVVPSPTLLEQR